MRRLTNLDARADAAGWLVAYPDAIDGHWNDGRDGPAGAAGDEGVDDVGFAVALVDHLVDVAGADRRRVYATGMSNGAMLCHRLAAERPDVVAAIAAVAGTMPERQLATEGAGPVAVLVVHGTADPIVPWAGGPVSGSPSTGRVASVEDTAGWWRRADGTGSSPTAEEPAGPGPEDPTSVRLTTWSGPGGADVALLAVDGGGHTWPGGLQYMSQRVIGRTTTHVHASDLVVRFFAGRTRLG